MEYCTVCKKALATIHILELEDGEVVNQKNLCGNCAEGSGEVHPKTTKMKISTGNITMMAPCRIGRHLTRAIHPSIATPPAANNIV